MREILFRGKRIDNGEWIYGGISIFCGLAEIFDSNSIDNSCYEVIPETVGQFTGLTDKNGKKIFEGDVISDGFENAEIKWFNDECQFLAEFDIELSEPQELGKWGIIIGNIHDNPELLNPTIA